MRFRREISCPGSTGSLPVVRGSLPRTFTGLASVWDAKDAFGKAAECYRFATANPSYGGLAACALQNMKR